MLPSQQKPVAWVRAERFLAAATGCSVLGRCEIDSRRSAISQPGLSKTSAARLLAPRWRPQHTVSCLQPGGSIAASEARGVSLRHEEGGAKDSGGRGYLVLAAVPPHQRNPNCIKLRILWKAYLGINDPFNELLLLLFSIFSGNVSLI